MKALVQEWRCTLHAYATGRITWGAYYDTYWRMIAKGLTNARLNSVAAASSIRHKA